MTIKYYNLRSGPYKVETFDEIDSATFKTYKEFRVAMFKLLYEYRENGFDCYLSQRSDKEWRER